MKTKAVRIPVGFYEEIAKFGEEIGAKTFGEAFMWYFSMLLGELAMLSYAVEECQEIIAYYRLPFYKKAWLRLKWFFEDVRERFR